MKEYYEKMLALRDQYQDSELAKLHMESMAGAYESGYLIALEQVLDIVEETGTFAPEHMMAMICASKQRTQLMKEGKIDKILETL